MGKTLAQLKLGKDLDGDSGTDPLVRPDWMDDERFRRGQQFFVRHIAAVLLALHSSLTLGLAIKDLLDSLVFTKRTDTPRKALFRYVQTFLHLFAWHTENVWDSSTFGHRSVQFVRRWHASVRRAMHKHEKHCVERVSQYDMAIVQAGFMAVIVMYPRWYGIRTTISELEDYIFFWRGIGHLLGIREEYNVCSGGSYAETYALCKEIEEQVMLAGLQQPPEKFEQMADAYIAGSSLPFHFSLFTKESLITFSMEVMGHHHLFCGDLSLADRLRVLFYKVICFCFLWVPGIEKLFNALSGRACRASMNLVHKQVTLATPAL